MACKPFAIVCDSTCDLPPEIISRLEVVCVPLGIEIAGRVLMDGADRDEAVALLGRRKSGRIELLSKERLLDVYRCLIDEGYDRIVTVCSSLMNTGSWNAAEQAASELSDAAHMLRTVDAGVSSVGLGMVVERLAMAREAGVGFDEAIARSRAFAREVRVLFIPEASSPFIRGNLRSRKSGIMAKASSLRLRVVGERTLFLMTRGESTALARSTDLSDLCGHAAHAMSSISAQEGELVHAVIGMGGSKALRALEKPLDTNEFCSTRLGRGLISPSILASVGPDAAGVAFAPRKAYMEAGAGRLLPRGIVYTKMATNTTN